MNILFRVDASYGIGSGHVLRCLNIANFLSKKKHKCFFIIRKEDMNYETLIRKSGHSVITFKIENDYFYSSSKKLEDYKIEDYDWYNDNQFTQQTIRRINPEIIFLDHYYLDYKWESIIYQKCKKLVVIDDLLNRKHKCHYYLNFSILDYQINKTTKKFFLNKCRFLTGSKYALLNDKYFPNNFPKKNRNKILISFGGADPSNEIFKSIKALEMFENINHQVIVIAGKYNKNFDSIKKYLNKKKLNNKIKLIKHTKIMHKIINQSFIALGACGFSTWERVCLGLPSLTISTAENQSNISKIIKEKKIGIFLGRSKNVDHVIIYKKMSYLINNQEKLNEMKNNCINFIDGKGINRLYKYIN